MTDLETNVLKDWLRRVEEAQALNSRGSEPTTVINTIERLRTKAWKYIDHDAVSYEAPNLSEEFTQSNQVILDQFPKDAIVLRGYDWTDPLNEVAKQLRRALGKK